jgi:Mg-chelatase subunit ChlD
VAALIALVAASWLAWPRERTGSVPESPAIQFVLVDASASASRPRAGWSRVVRERLQDACERATTRGADLCVIRFAAEVLVDYGPAPAAGFRDWLAGRGQPPYSPACTPARSQGSELEGALAVVREVLSSASRPARDMLLLTDGTCTGADPRASLEALLASGVGLERFEYPVPDRADLALVELRIGDRIEAGVPLVAELGLAWVPSHAQARLADPGAALVSLELRSESGEVSSVTHRSALTGAAKDLDGCLRWTVQLQLPAAPLGSHVLRARVRFDGATSGDAFPENDARSKQILIGDPLVCLLLTRAERADALRQLFRGPAFDGISFQPTTLARLAGDLGRADLLLTESIGPADLPRAAMLAFVRAGGGWASLGGYGALRGWDSDDPQALAASLPLAIEEPDPSEREVILFIDGSGSMVGEPFETVRRAVMELVLGARAHDRIRLRFFTGAMGDVVFETRGARREDLQRDLAPLFAARVPRGPTDVLYALDQLATRRESSAVRGLVLLVTDGRTLDWYADRSAEVRQALAASTTDLRIIAIGAGADREFLRSLLLEGEQLDEVADLKRIQAVFEQRVHAERVRDTGQGEEGGAFVRAVDLSTLDAQGVAVDILRAQIAPATPGGGPQGGDENSGQGLGAVARLVPTRARPGAEILWRTDDGTPLLGLWRIGAGLVTVMATTPLDGWAPFVGARSDLLAPLLRTLGRGFDGGRDQRLRMSQEGGDLWLEHVPAGTPAEVRATFVLRSHASGPAEALADFDPDRAFRVQERTLGVVSMAPPAAGLGLDPRTLRCAARPAFLDRVGSAVELAVDLSAAGQALGRVFLAMEPAAEASVAKRRAFSWPQITGKPSTGGEAEPTPARLPHPATPWVLALGVALATLAATRSS